MGDPKKIRKKYKTPSHPWQKNRIEQEIALKREYGLRNKREIWIMTSKLKKFKDQFKKLNAQSGAQADKEKDQLRTKLLSLGLISQDAPLDTVLGLETKDLMERRLQTVLVRKNLARSIKQARQFITHRHVLINGNKVTAPSYLVKLGEEGSITFVQTSNLSDPNHPERYQDVAKDRIVKKKASEKKEEEIAAFEDVPEDEEAILKEIPKKDEGKTEEEQPAEAEKVVTEEAPAPTDPKQETASEEAPKEEKEDKKE